ncbi:cytoplasmic protein [bacterium]|nr:cytoplasmic protein [bacterium]
MAIEQFISEAIRPVVATCNTARMAVGEPGLPREFVWRRRTFTVASVLRTWRETGPCRHGSAERYVRKHWFEVVTTAHATMKIYFERQPRRGARRSPRWWLFSIREPEP